MLSDMFTADERGKAISIYSVAPLIGPVVGPIAGAWIAQETTWRWVFRSSTIGDAIVQVIGLFFLKESEYPPVFCDDNICLITPTAYPPVLLKRKAAEIMRQMDLEKVTKRVITVNEANSVPRR